MFQFLFLVLLICTPPVFSETTANSLLSSGDSYYNQKKYAQALNAYKQVVIKEPANLIALESLRKASVAANDTMSTSVFLDNILQKDPSNTNARKVQIEVYYDMAKTMRKFGADFNQPDFIVQAEKCEKKAESLKKYLIKRSY